MQMSIFSFEKQNNKAMRVSSIDSTLIKHNLNFSDTKESFNRIYATKYTEWRLVLCLLIEDTLTLRFGFLGLMFQSSRTHRFNIII